MSDGNGAPDPNGAKPQKSAQSSLHDYALEIARQTAELQKGLSDGTGPAAELSYAQESQDYQRAQEQVRKERAKNERREDNNRLRKDYAEKAYQLAVYSVGVWSVMFIALAISNAFSGKPLLSDNALVTLTTGATINVLAAFLAIVRGLFPNKAN